MFRTTLIVIPLLFLTGCGIQGSLYLPPNAVNDSYIHRLRQEFNDFIGTDTVTTAPEDDTVIEVVDPKNFTINGEPMEELEGTEDLPMEGTEEGEAMESPENDVGEAFTTPIPESGATESNSAIQHELPVRGNMTPNKDSTGTE